jgi:putative NADH-flavin reductase
MNIALLGATGAVGGHFLTKALAAGYAIKALVRTPEKLRKDASLSALKGDVANPVDVAELIRGTDVVVSCLGNVKGMLIMEKAAEVILQTAAEQSKPPKCLFISSIGCGGTSWTVKCMLQMIGGRSSFADYERADARISREEVVPYVLVRPAALKEKPGNGKYRCFHGDGTFVRPIAKEDVAKFLLDAVSSNQWDGHGGIQLAGVK